MSEPKELPVLPKQLPFGSMEAAPLPDKVSPDKRKLDGGYMVVTPPKAVVAAAIKAGQPVTSRRVAIVELHPYLNKQEAEVYAQAIAALPELIRACQRAANSLGSVNRISPECPGGGAREELIDKIKAALAKAGIGV